MVFYLRILFFIWYVIIATEEGIVIFNNIVIPLRFPSFKDDSIYISKENESELISHNSKS